MSATTRTRRLSRRKVKALVEIGQFWTSEDGREWRVCQVWRHEGRVQLARPVGRERRTVAFGELGDSYSLVESA